MVLSFRITFSGLADVRYARGRFVELANYGLALAMLWWHRHVAPKHFRRGAEGTYRYRKRKPRILRTGQRIDPDEMKRRRYGRALPLVAKGWMQRDVTRRIAIRKHRRRPLVRGRMRGPEYLHPAGRPGRSRSGGRLPDIGAEITRVTDDEAKRITTFAGRGTLRKLGHLRNRRTVRIG